MSYASRMQRLVLSVALAGLALGACGKSSSSSQRVRPEDASQLLIDRNWIDVMPKQHDDRLHVYRFVPSMGGGVFQDRTVFKGTFELFSFRATGDEIAFKFPETRQQVTSAYHIETVDGPKPFDLKLVIDGDPRGPKTYYGTRGTKDLTGAALEHDLGALAAE